MDGPILGLFDIWAVSCFQPQLLGYNFRNNLDEAGGFLGYLSVGFFVLLFLSVQLTLSSAFKLLFK